MKKLIKKLKKASFLRDMWTIIGAFTFALLLINTLCQLYSEKAFPTDCERMNVILDIIITVFSFICVLHYNCKYIEIKKNISVYKKAKADVFGSNFNADDFDAVSEMTEDRLFFANASFFDREKTEVITNKMPYSND